MNHKTRQKLESWRDRMKTFALCGHTAKGVPWSEELHATFEERLKQSETERLDQNKRLGKLFERMHSGDMEAKHALCEIIFETTQNYIMPNLEFGRFFETVSLGDGDSPGEINLSRKEFKCKVISQDNGQAEIVKVTKERRTVAHDLFIVSTPRIEWVTRDLYRGNIENAAQVMVDVAEVLAQEIEKRLHPEGSSYLEGGATGALETGVFGNFTLTGANTGRVWAANSMIKAGNLPTSNELSITGVSGSTHFDFASMDKVLAYGQQFAGTRDVDGKGDLIPTGELFVPTLDAPAILQDITAVTGAKSTPIAEQLAENGWMELPRYGGVNWKVIPVQSISRKRLYARFNRSVGKIYFKPSADVFDEGVDKMKNLAWRQEGKAMSIVIPLPNVKNIVRVRYQSA